MPTKSLALILALSGCTGALPPGAQCKQDGDCEKGVACLDVAQINGTTCTVVGKACSIVCLDDSGCSTLGSNFKCFAGCGTDKTCEEIATP